MDELKHDFVNLSKNYDIEIQAMFFELSRMKEEVSVIKSKTGINTNP